MSTFTISQASLSESILVGEMVYEMENELWGEAAGNLDKNAFIESAKRLIDSNDNFWAFLAKNESNTPVGVITLSESCAIYAGGKFGEIMEMFIFPEYRSAGIGHELVVFAKKFAVEKNWKILEVGSPAQPRWARTYDFYVREGFKEIGPRLELSI